MEWLTLLQKATPSMRTHPAVMTLATCDTSGAPRARSVVCRHVERDGSLWFATDARSAKNTQLDAFPVSEVVCWLSESREQFRFFGSVRRLTAAHRGDERLAIWKRLTDASRALFFWPAPGDPKVEDPAAFPAGVPESTFPPMTFELLVLDAEEVEYLDLKLHPHRRVRWQRENNWNAEELNP